MSQRTSEPEVCQMLLDFVSEGTHPRSENISVAEFPLSVLSKELELISEARQQVEKEISFQSRENTFDADDWMSQAKQLHADIERSRLTAREIVAQHEKTKPLELRVADAAAKVKLVQTEIAFNQAVTSTLEAVQKLCQQLDAGRVALSHGQVTAAIETVEETMKSLKKDSLFTNTNVMNILSKNIMQLRQEVAEYLRTRWNEQVRVDKDKRELQVRTIDGITLEETVAALLRLELFPSVNEKFQRDLTATIINAIILPGVDGRSHGVRVGEFAINVDPEPSAVPVSEVLGRIVEVLGYLRCRLPTLILDLLSDSFIPKLSSDLISGWLSSAIPTDLSGLGEFEKTLNHVLQFTQTLESLGWHGEEELTSWVQQAPRLWLTRRRIHSLDQVRNVLAAKRGITRQVEKVETENVTQANQTLLHTTFDEWDAQWDNNKEEVTLREKYNITDIPDAVLTIIRQQIADAEALSQPTYSTSKVAPSGPGLLALPTLIIAMYKAIASSFYALKLKSGQIYLYNDSQYLASQIRAIAEERQLTRLKPDIVSLEKFGKLAYMKEMQVQRTIVSDLLDGAQGFNRCSEQPFLGECENAVSATVDRIRDVYKEWQPILSYSALLQSIGSLLSTILNKIIIDTEELGDISEAQSKRLVLFCNKISTLEDLFMPESVAGAEAVPMTAIYVPNWFKFQYLVNILESSLADIKYLWVEGELRLEFSADEVVDLIKALFAESDHRRKAIAEIRRTSRG